MVKYADIFKKLKSFAVSRNHYKLPEIIRNHPKTHLQSFAIIRNHPKSSAINSKSSAITQNYWEFQN